MRIIHFLLIILFFLSLTISKRIAKTIKLREFHREGPFIFFTKMHLGIEQAQMDITYHKNGQIASQSFYNDVAIGMLNNSLYPQFVSASSCEQKSKMLFKRDNFYFKQERHGMKHVKIFDLKQPQLWHFYVFSCHANIQELAKNNEQIYLQLTVLNNGSQFDQNDYMLSSYILIFVLWIILVLKFAIPIAELLSLSNPNALKIIVYGGLVLLGTSYLYRLIHLAIFWTDGSGVHIFQVLYLILKNIAEAIITAVMIAVAWGWSIVHLKPSQNYIIIGVISGIINIISLILSSLTEQHQELYHSYDTVPGTVVLVLRIVVFFIFVLGICDSLRESSGRIVHFIRKVGIVGGIYLISWPLTVLIVELIFPEEQHRNIIVFVEEFVHLCGCTILCTMISYQQSSYRSVSLHEDDNPLNMVNYKKR